MKLTAVGPMGFENLPPASFFPLIARADIRSVHVALDKKNRWPLTQIREVLAEFRLSAESYHCRFGESIDLASDDPNTRLSALDVIAREAEFAAALGVDEMVIHPCGLRSNLINPADSSQSSPRDNFLRALEKLIRVLEPFSIKGLMENLPPDFNYGVRVEDLAEDVKRFDSPLLGVCLDIGHANMRTDLSLPRQILAAGGSINYIHAHDNFKTGDDHLLPFTGSVDWTGVFEVLNEVGYEGSFCLEIFEPIEILERKITHQWIDKIRQFVTDS